MPLGKTLTCRCSIAARPTVMSTTPVIGCSALAATVRLKVRPRGVKHRSKYDRRGAAGLCGDADHHAREGPGRTRVEASRPTRVAVAMRPIRVDARGRQARRAVRQTAGGQSLEHAKPVRARVVVDQHREAATHRAQPRVAIKERDLLGRLIGAAFAHAGGH